MTLDTQRDEHAAGTDGDLGRSQTGTGARRGVARDAQLRVRVAWHYYVEGLTQAQLSETLGVSRSIVNRLLARCRADGLIEIKINSPLAHCISLEAALMRDYGLKDAIVIPTPGDDRDLADALGAQAGEYLSDRIDGISSLGVGWGRTLWHTLRHVRRVRDRSLSVVSLLGGLHRTSAVSAYETSTRLAEILGARCYYLAAPVYAGDSESRRVLREQDFIREVLRRAYKCDFGLVSAGDMSDQATMRQLGLVSETHVAELREAGAVGNVLGHYLDAEGKPVDHPLNEQVIAFEPWHLCDLPYSVLVSGGRERLPIIRGVLNARYANILITDENTASRLVTDEGR